MCTGPTGLSGTVGLAGAALRLAADAGVARAETGGHPFDAVGVAGAALRLAADAGVARAETGGNPFDAVGLAGAALRLAADAGVARAETGGHPFDAIVPGHYPADWFHLHRPRASVPDLLTTGERAGTGAERPAFLPGQGVAPAATTIETINSLGLDLVPGAGLLAATVPGARCAWQMSPATTAASRWTPSSASPRVRRDRSPVSSTG